MIEVKLKIFESEGYLCASGVGVTALSSSYKRRYTLISVEHTN